MLVYVVIAILHNVYLLVNVVYLLIIYAYKLHMIYDNSVILLLSLRHHLVSKIKIKP